MWLTLQTTSHGIQRIEGRHRDDATLKNVKKCNRVIAFIYRDTGTVVHVRNRRRDEGRTHRRTGYRVHQRIVREDVPVLAAAVHFYGAAEVRAFK